MTFLENFFDPEVINNDKYISTKIKSDKDEITSDFYDKALPPKRTLFATYSIILTDSVYKIYYRQVLLE